MLRKVPSSYWYAGVLFNKAMIPVSYTHLDVYKRQLEYVEGEAITDWCRARDLDVEARLKLFLQVCEAVSHAHANLIVHRDLKPSNILVTPLDEVRLLDFGIAKLLDGPEPGREHTRTEVRAFTLHYAAPEQIRGEPVTTMTDVYSLGVVLYLSLIHI